MLLFMFDMHTVHHHHHHLFESRWFVSSCFSTCSTSLEKFWAAERQVMICLDFLWSFRVTWVFIHCSSWSHTALYMGVFEVP